MMPRPTVRTDVNRSAILAHLGSQGPASRADLARALSVSPALMTALTKDLIAEGLVQELEVAPSQGGRPARMLGLAASAGSAIGMKVVSDHVTLVEVGIDGRVLRSASEPFDASAATLLADLAALLTAFIVGAATRRVLGIGVGVPGSVDRQGIGTVDSSQLDWHQVPLGESLRRALELPVIVENNVNALAMAERLHGVGRRHNNFLVVTIGTGVGAGIVIDGVALRGSGGGAGEIGHTPVIEDGPVCTCGNHGCLEAIVGQEALVARGRALGVIGESAGIVALTERADAGDAAAAAIFSEAGHVLGRTLAGIVQSIDPEIVIVLGEGTAAWPHWQFGFEPAFRAALLPGRRGIGVVVESWQDASWAQGAASLVLATSFDTDGVAGDQGRLVRERLVAGAPEQTP